MTEPVQDRDAMIAGMRPDLFPGTFVFCSLSDGAGDGALLAQALASFREEEGLSLLLPLEVAQARGLATDQPMRRITLQVYSSLSGVGLTAAVATALAEAGIPCNMIAATHHDHAFVPADRAEQALAILQDLSRRR